MYIKELEILKGKAIEHNICSNYLEIWDKSITKKDFIDMALSSQGALFMAQSMNNGWGVTSSFIKRNFEMFINGKYTYDKGYLSRMYVCYNDEVLIDTNITILVECDCIINIPNDWVRYDIYLCGNCNITLKGNGSVLLYMNTNSLYNIDKHSNINVKHINV